MNKIKSLTLTALLLAPLAALHAAHPAPSRFQHFITRQADKLMDGDQEFRFIGVNMPGLVLPYDFTLRLPERLVLPTPWEQADGFRSLVQMNARVARTWNLPMRGPKDGDNMAWAYVQGPGKFNEDSFKTLDQALALANEHGIRLILPLSADSGDYLGGVGTYAAWRVKKRSDFWSDPQLKADYQATLRHVINRTNTITGVAYRDDKAILAWQFGNEMRSASIEWEAEMAGFIKRLDPNHLVMAGNDSRVPTNPPPALDIVTRHYYGGDFAKTCRANRATAQGQRPLIIGEYGLTSDVGAVRRFLDEVITNGTSGALIWSMYFHHRNGGFYWHQIFTHPSLSSYHWPGFAAGAAHNEQPLLGTLREYAFRIQGQAVPPLPVPEPPELLPIGEVPLLSWRGSAGASGYDIERAPKSDGPWTTLARNVSDADIAYRPLFSDTNAHGGETWFYRVIACNVSGASKPSNVVGPVQVKRICLADELQDFSRVQAKSAGLKLNNEYNALYAEYPFRAQGSTNDWITYQVPTPIELVRVVAFYSTETAVLTFGVSANGTDYTDIKPMKKVQKLPRPPGGAAGGQRRTMVEYECAVPAGNYCLKIFWNGPAELDRVEIYHP